MGNIVVLGPRSSGKTTFLAGLAYWPKKRQNLQKKSVFSIQPLNEEAKTLQDKAENIILQSSSLEATKITIGGVSELPVYSFRLQVKKEAINLVVRDYAGELFDGLNSHSMQPEHEEFFQESLMKDVTGCLILLTGWERHHDQEYYNLLKVFTNLIDYYQRNLDYRIAVALSKCERGELWPGRIEPEVDIFNLHLPLSKSILEEKIPAQNLAFYAVSTFGVLGRNDPRPNRIDEDGRNGAASILREPSRWQPYNLIAPLYWLSTGKKFKAHV